MKIEEIATQVKPEWREDFLKFIETGNASAEFLKHLDEDENCQVAVSQAFVRQAMSLQNLAATIKTEPSHRTSNTVLTILTVVAVIGTLFFGAVVLINIFS